MVNAVSLQSDFAARFDGSRPTVRLRAPGRATLLGEHTDYNDGYVLPVATEQAIVIQAAPRQDRTLALHSTLMNETAVQPLEALGGNRPPGQTFTPIWTNYVFGVAVLLAERGLTLPAAGLLIDSDLPAGGGVSSSAALEVAAAKTLLALADEQMDDVELALLARQAEHEFAGSPCGILDQFASVCSRAGHVLFLDCRSRAFEHVPFLPDPCVIAILDTQTKHELSKSEYPLRQAQCRTGVEALQRHAPEVTALRDVSVALLDRHGNELDPLALRRCRHVVTENTRVLDGVEALRAADAERFGRLMTESHASLRDDYEVSCEELDALVDVTIAVDGVRGAKMSGGGFGGCVVAVVAADAVDQLSSAVRTHYDPSFAKSAKITITRPAAGAEVEML